MSTDKENAIKFLSLLNVGRNYVDAYIEVFPNRYVKRMSREGSAIDISMEALLYSRSKLLLNLKEQHETH